MGMTGQDDAVICTTLAQTNKSKNIGEESQ